ncbi:MAG: hypothetical protein ABI947_19025 [Chloroflexota bacterium]
MLTQTRSKPDVVLLPLIAALTIRLLLTLYWIGRYSGYWIEGDTSRTTSTILATLNSGLLYSDTGRTYSNGFGYQVYAAIVAQLSAVDVNFLQLWIFPFMGLVVTLIAFAFYYRALNNAPIAGLAATFLGLQADLLFTTNRGTHEKLIFIFILVALMAIGLALTAFESMAWRAGLALVYYLAMFGLASTNVFFSSSFIATLILAVIGWMLLTRSTTLRGIRVTWLIYLAAVCFIFVILIVFFIYPPSVGFVSQTRNLLDRLLLFLSPHRSESSGLVYSSADWAWIIPFSWLFLRLFDFFVLGLAALGWLYLAWQIFRRTRILDHISTALFWLIILLPAFAVQNAFSIVSDLSSSSGSFNNLQIRLAPLTILIAAPFAAYTFLSILRWLLVRRGYLRMVFTLCIVMVMFTTMALLKSTSEPLLSNTWLFYAPAEAQSVEWLNSHISLMTRDNGLRTPRVWAGPDFRIGELWLNNFWGQNRASVPVVSSPTERFNYVLSSPVTQAQTSRLREAFPDVTSANRIYDNGSTQLYLTGR